jgi:hypothetical protein
MALPVNFSRPAIAEKRLSLTPNGNVLCDVNKFKSVASAWMRRSGPAEDPYRDGTTYVIFKPLDFLAQLATLVPKPRVNLTRFHGIFAPNRSEA